MTFIPLKAFYVGEIPPATECRYEDKANNLITSIAGTTITCKYSVNEAAEATVSCTNNNDGSFTIDWPTGASIFTPVGNIVLQIWITDGALVYPISDKISIPIK